MMTSPSADTGIKLGLVTYNVGRDWDVPMLIDMCARTGYAAVELRTSHAHGVEPSLNRDQRRTIRQQFADSPVELFGLGTTCEFHSPDPAEVRRQIDLCREFIELAADVGARGVKVRPNGLPENVEATRTLAQIGTALDTCARIGADHGILVYMEVHGNGTSHPPHMQTMMQHVDSSNAGLCWNCNGTDVKDGSVSEHFHMLRPWLVHVHLHELADESYPYREFFELLFRTNYTGCTLAEAGASTEPERFMRYYRALWQAYQIGLLTGVEPRRKL